MSIEQISLYIGELDAVDTPDGYRTCISTLSPSEKQRAEYFVFDRHRRQYVFAHGLLRLALSNDAPEVEPSDWSFVTDCIWATIHRRPCDRKSDSF